MFLGCGFLASHIIETTLPLCSHLFLVDYQSVEQVNYENSIFPKGLLGRKKVSALAGLVQVLSSVPVTLITTEIKTTDQLRELHDRHDPELVIVTFDNIEARLLAKSYFTGKVPIIFVGVTENYIYIDWDIHTILPETPEKITAAVEEMARVKDVCSRAEFRGLGIIAAAYVYNAVNYWMLRDERLGYIIVTRGAKIDVATLERGSFDLNNDFLKVKRLS